MAVQLATCTIGLGHPTYIIAEIGQNHQGDISLAKQLIEAAKDAGADCVKFQKTNLGEKFNQTALNQPYLSEHSWGSTYGAHKAFLEFSEEQFAELQAFSHSLNIHFTASAMDQTSFQFLQSLQVPFVKIGSGDGNNFQLLEQAAASRVPLVISTGMQSWQTVQKIYDTVCRHHKNFALLHCVSSYPTQDQDCNLNILKLYQQQFSDICVGYSGHELGTTISVAAVALGAKVIERHLTLNQLWKGSDHACSLLPQDFAQMVRDIRRVETALGHATMKSSPADCELLCHSKLGKTLVANGPLLKGTQLSKDNVKVKVALPKGIDGADWHLVMGKTLSRDIQHDESITYADIIFDY